MLGALSVRYAPCLRRGIARVDLKRIKETKRNKKNLGERLLESI
jgi:hypothetical protein